MKKLFLSLLSGTLAFSAFAGLATTEVDAQGNSLTVYTALAEDESAFYFDEFTAETGIEVNFVRLSAGEILARVEAEAENPQATVWFGGSTDNFINAAGKGLLAQYESANIGEVPEEFTDPEGYWTPFYVGALGFAVNTDWLAEGNEAPNSWEDLLDERFADNVMMAHPASSGTAYSIYATLVQLLGEDEAISYLQQLDGNIRQYTTSGSAPAQQAGLGEAAVGLAFAHDILKPIDEGFPLELHFPEEGTGYEVGAVAMLANAPEEETEAAQTFIDWILTVEAQNLLSESGAFRNPLNPNATVAEGAVPLSEIKLIDYDAVWSAENRDHLLERFNREVTGEEAAVEVN